MLVLKGITIKLKTEKSRFRRVSNPGPFACEANVITTTLRNHTDLNALNGLANMVLCVVWTTEQCTGILY